MEIPPNDNLTELIFLKGYGAPNDKNKQQNLIRSGNQSRA
jgi:hypothetical protein